MKKKLTIFTPTYNRAYILPNLYHSLRNQKLDNYRFEWLIVDDESTDNTQQLVESWLKEENPFEIRYYKQKHGGKHRALNKAFDLAEGEFFFIVDSDDYLTNDAIWLIDHWVLKINDDPEFAGVAGLRVSSKGNIWGGAVSFSDDYVDATDFEREKFHLLGDKAEVYRTSILQKFKFPEIKGEYFVTEDFCWMQIASAGYKLRWYNQPIYICEYLDDGLTNNGANTLEGHKNNYKGYCLYVKKCLQCKPFTIKMAHLQEYEKTGRALRIAYNDRARNLQMSVTRYLMMCVFGIPMAYIVRKVRNLK